MIANYIASNHRHYRVLVPDGAPPETWQRGIFLGPPDLDSLGLSEEVTTRLHNELFNRGIMTAADANTRRLDVQSALQYAMRVDAQSIINLYEESKVHG
jgi:hypothetical protein